VFSWLVQVAEQAVHKYGRFRKVGLFSFKLLSRLVSFSKLGIKIAQVRVEPGRDRLVDGPRLLEILLQLAACSSGVALSGWAYIV
jgi:hypothetical protein